MNLILLGVIVLLLGFLYYERRSRKARSVQLKHIQTELDRIISAYSSEKLLLFTEDREIRPILIEINRLLNHNQKIMAKQAGTELSLRRMLSNISHDLKTPLTVVLGYLETMNLGPNMSAEERTAILAKVHGKTLEVLELIRQFFDLAKLESGDQDITLTRIHLNEICRKNMLAFYEILTSRGFEADIRIPEEPVHVLGNEGALDRILNNLISNAIQYGGDGQAVGLTLRQDEDYAYVEVWDRGKGIAEPHQDRVFERMYTLEDSRNKSYQGSGLGLTITKRLVETLGGEIRLHSIPHERTVFSIQLKKIRY